MENLSFETPEEAIHHANECLTAESTDRIPQALQIFSWFLDQEPDNHTILFAIASCHMRMRQYGMAEALFRYTLTIQEDFHEALNNLGFVRQSLGDVEGCKDFFNQALELDPENPEYIGNVATQYVNEGDPEKCIELCNKALELNPNANEPLWNRALAELELGQWKQGWEDYKQGLFQKTTSSQHRKRRHYGEEDATPYWEGEPDKSVVVYGEQGVGDEIMCASLLEEAADVTNIVYECHPRLVEIMRHSFGDKFPIYGTRKVPWAELQFPKWTQIDAKCPIFNLAGMFRNSDEDFPRKPYLKPFSDKVDKYKERLRAISDRPKIGIGWKGGSGITRRDLRSIPLPLWTTIFDNIDADFISLQYDPADRMGWNAPIVEGFNEDMKQNLIHWPEVINDLDECYGGLIHALDLVICINTSLVHACGAYGVDCWTLTPNKPAWRYNMPGVFKDNEMIWYGPHVQQIRQAPGDEGWEEVLETVQRQLDLQFSARIAV